MASPQDENDGMDFDDWQSSVLSNEIRRREEAEAKAEEAEAKVEEVMEEFVASNNAMEEKISLYLMDIATAKYGQEVAEQRQEVAEQRQEVVEQRLAVTEQRLAVTEQSLAVARARIEELEKERDDASRGQEIEMQDQPSFALLKKAFTEVARMHIELERRRVAQSTRRIELTGVAESGDRAEFVTRLSPMMSFVERPGSTMWSPDSSRLRAISTVPSNPQPQPSLQHPYASQTFDSTPPVTLSLSTSASSTRSTTPNVPPTYSTSTTQESTSPSTPGSATPRPSSRRALTAALALAQQAVSLDTTNHDPQGAVLAYSRSVALLSEVMERVARGDESEGSARRRSGRRRSVVAREEEVRRLRSIHDTYADRMRILCLIHCLEEPPLPASTLSRLPPNPPDDACERSPPVTQHTSTEEAESIGSTIFSSSQTVTLPSSPARSSVLVSPPPPPPAPLPTPPPLPTQITPSVVTPATRMSALPPSKKPPSGPPPLRPRAASGSLPPPSLPPPTVALPPPPTPEIVEPTSPVRISHLTRSRGNSNAHKRTGSGSERLGPVDEEAEMHSEDDHLTVVRPERIRSSSLLNINQSRESSVAIASSSSTPSSPSALTPRASSADPRGPPPTSNIQTQNPRQRGNSNASLHSDSSAASLSTPTASGHSLVIHSTDQGTISRRRQQSSLINSASSSTSSIQPAPGRLTASALPAGTAAALGIGRNRALSQPGRRPPLVTSNTVPGPEYAGRPPMPMPPMTAGIVTRKSPYPSRLNPNVQPLPSPMTPGGTFAPPAPLYGSYFFTAPGSVPPTAPPSDPLRKPYHLMQLLRISMVNKTGGFITRRLHVPHEVWTLGGAKLNNLPEKIRVIETLIAALDEIHSSSVEFCGAGGVNGLGLVTGGNGGRKEGDKWVQKLEEWERTCEGVVAEHGKKLGVGEGFSGKKDRGVSAWGARMTRSINQITNGKSLDTPSSYVYGLAKLFQQAQLLDEHTRALSTQPLCQTYSTLPGDLRASVETRLKRSSEFFATVVLTFVVRDMGVLLDKYAKRGQRYLEE